MPFVAVPRQSPAQTTRRWSEETAGNLLAEAHSHPARAAERAESLLSDGPDDVIGSVAWQTLGIVSRDDGDIKTALHHLRQALRLARRAGEQQRVADVLATLGGTQVRAGATSRGLSMVEEAAGLAQGQTLARVQMRHAYLLASLGRHAEALVEIRRAVVGLRRAGDRVWEARAINNRALIYISLGEVARAERDLQRAHGLFTELGQQLEAASALHNLGFLAYIRNDIPGALRLLAAAGEEYDALGFVSTDLAIDRCTVLLTAGLPAEGAQIIERVLESDSVLPAKRSELLLASARAALAAGDPVRARHQAELAARLFKHQQRGPWATRARLVAVQADFADGGSGHARLYSRVAGIADGLEAEGSDEAALAHLLAGRIALSRSIRGGEAHLRVAARHRHAGAPVARVTGWIAHALANEHAGRSGTAMIACARGLEELREHSATFGSLELRALATAHGAELARIGLRHAVKAGRPRSMVEWTERWRATALQLPNGPEAGRQPEAELAALRQLNRRLEQLGSSDGDDPSPATVAALRQERSRLEELIRTRQHMASSRGAGRIRFHVPDLVDSLGEHTFVELLVVDTRLFAVVAVGARLHKHEVGTVARAQRALGSSRFTLHGLGRGVPLPFAHVGAELQEALLGDVVHRLGDGPVVISPPSRFHDTPWGLMPALTDRPVSVTPSAAQWVRSRRTTEPAASRVVLVAGPRLAEGEHEVEQLRRIYPEAVVLTGTAATVDRTLREIEGAALVHFASHGNFRSDNPMFSSLSLYDGPLTVHDLGRLRKPPFRMVLPACDSGIGSHTGSDELLGLASALVGLGTAGLASSVSQVNDRATVPVMVAIHSSLRDGRTLPTALAAARRTVADGSDLQRATAASFVAFGV